MCFSVYDKRNDYNLTTVFSIQNDKKGYPHFLIFEDNQWKWISAKHFSMDYSPEKRISKTREV